MWSPGCDTYTLSHQNKKDQHGNAGQGKTDQDHFTPGEQINQLRAWWRELCETQQRDLGHNVFAVMIKMMERKLKHEKL